jgi:hypothetical protein
MTAFLGLVFLQFFEHVRFFPVTLTKPVAAVFLILVFANRTYWRKPGPAVICLASCAGVVVASSLWHLPDLDERLRSYAMSRVSSLMQMMVLLYATYCFCSKRDVSYAFAWALVLGGLSVACLAAGGYGLTTGLPGRESFGGLDANIAGSLVGFAIVAAVGLLLQTRRVAVRVLACVLILAMASFLARTGSRGGFLATALAIFALLLASRRWQHMAWLSVGGALVVWRIIAQEQTVERWRLFAETGDTSLRNVIFSDAFRLFLERPVFGRGEVNAYFDLGERFGRMMAGHHNQILWSMNTGGIIAALLLLSGGFFVARSAFAARSRWSGRLALAYGVMLATVCMSVEYHNVKLMWIMLGYLASIPRLPNAQEEDHEVVSRRGVPCVCERYLHARACPVVPTLYRAADWVPHCPRS